MTASGYHLPPDTPPKKGEFVSDDIDLRALKLVLNKVVVRDVRPWISAGTLERTILGASSVTIDIEDPHYALLQSRSILAGVDVKIDGVWFRFVGLKKQETKLTLTFEDRAVSLLRDYPKKGEGHMVASVRQTTRALFAQRLVREVKETPIGFICPALNPAKVPTSSKDIPARSSRDANHQYGFPDPPDVTVKNRTASKEQLANVDAILHTGLAMGARRKVLAVAVMVATQESDMKTSATNGTHVGLFQQDPRYWPATRDPVTDSRAFFERAIADDKRRPTDTYEDLGENVQNPGDSGPGNQYSQWRVEAEHTLTQYGVPGGDTSSGADIAAANGQNPLHYTVKGDSAGAYTRGSVQTIDGKPIWKRETNWDCLTRLANEVNWRCYADQGDVHFVTDLDLFRSRPLMTITEAPALDALGLPLEKGVTTVDSIDGDFDRGKKAAQLDVKCRISRWGAPPGALVGVVHLGPVFSGRWLVQTISRDLFSAAATITLVKPQAVVPDAQSAEWTGAGKAELNAANGTRSGRTVYKPPTGARGPVGASTDGAVRDAIVAAAKTALAQKANYGYKEVRPIPASLFLGTPKDPEIIDCSAFFTLCYKEAGAPDPNGPAYNYNGKGFTGTLAAYGTYTQAPQPGDACMYGTNQKVPGHVTVYIGDGKCISMGGQGDPVELPAKYRSDFLGYVTFPLAGA